MQVLLIDRCDMNVSIPKVGGTYALWLYCPKGARITVGRLGAIDFKRGWYAYAGSAFGPGGLAARVGRHLREKKKIHWHIDYLRAIAKPREIWFSTKSEPLEHVLAAVLYNGSGAPVKGFGCTDCRCISHLSYFSCRPDANLLDSF